MAVTCVLATPSEKASRKALKEGRLGIALYRTGSEELPGLGHHLPKQFALIGGGVDPLAWDFLSIALAVFGVDRFVPRATSPDGWTRTIDLEIAVQDGKRWGRHATDLSNTLRFLTGDFWRISFVSGGAGVPTGVANETAFDCACLFSGGLDSLIGAADLVTAGRSPLLVSQASPKEGPYQQDLARRLGLHESHFMGRVTERYAGDYEHSMRARSLLFFAYGVACASTLAGKGPQQLVVPENGFISLNPPLTMRRVGSLSTRTTHPHFTNALQALLSAVGIDVRLIFPYQFKTKGEMLRECRHPKMRAIASLSYSCGKGKRLNQQCGRCVPCLVRRAAFLEAKIADKTAYRFPNLRFTADNDDVAAVRLACVEHGARKDWVRWATQTGPLDPSLLDKYGSVIKRGTNELGAFISAVAWPS